MPLRFVSRTILFTIITLAALASQAFVLNLVAATPPRDLGLPSGTEVEVRLMDELTTENAEPGDTFTATLMRSVVVNGRRVVARDTTVQGRVVEAVSSGRLKRPASITLELTHAGQRTLVTEPLTLDGKSHKGRNVALIGGGAGAGAILGGVAGGKKGSIIGGLIGAGAGTATAYMTGKNELVLPVEMALTFVAGGAATAAAPPQEPEPSYEAPTTRTRTRRGRASSTRGRSPRGSVEVIFSEQDGEIIEEYVSEHGTGLPPGLARKDRLPPGLERQLRRNGRLPPGLQKRLSPFPHALEAQLGRLPRGHRRVFLGKRALILTAANVIMDIFHVR
jgi:hypothetical protein